MLKSLVFILVAIFWPLSGHAQCYSFQNTPGQNTADVVVGPATLTLSITNLPAASTPLDYAGYDYDLSGLSGNSATVTTGVRGYSYSQFNSFTSTIIEPGNMSVYLGTLAVGSLGNLFATDYWISSLYEFNFQTFNFQTLTLPFTTPGSGQNPSLVESLLSVGGQPLGGGCQTVVAYNSSNSSQTGVLNVTGNMGGVVNSTRQAAPSLVYPQAVLEPSEGSTSGFSGPLSFGSNSIGGYANNEYVYVYNPTSATLQITSVSFTGPGAADFSVDTFGSSCLAVPVGPGGNCYLDLLFEPQAAGVRNATMVINSNAAQPTTLAVTGTGLLPGVLSPSLSQVTFSLSASSVSAPQTITLQNTGGAYLSFSEPPYLLSSTVNMVSDSCSNIYTLTPGASCSITLQAAASSTPSTSQLLIFYSNLVQTRLELDIPITTVIPTPPAPLNFVPVTPCRVADTRNAPGDFGGPFITGGSKRSFTIPSSACNIPSSAAAYSLNVAVVPHGPLGYLTSWATGQPQPFVATLNSDGRVKSTAAIVPAGTNGAASFYATDDTDLVLDINGYFVASSSNTGLNYYVLNPCRVADTREANGALGGPLLTAGLERDFPLQQSSSCGVPSEAQAYSVNLAAVPQAGGLGYLTAWPFGEAQPLVASLNAPTGSVTSNAALVPAGTGGDVALFASDNTQVVIDINGYFAPASASGLHFYTVPPCRVLDTRNAVTEQPFTGTLAVMVGGICNIPSNASAVVVNATVVPATPLGYLTMWADGEPQPYVATLNASDGAITSNMAIVPMMDGAIDAFATSATHLVVDTVGYFAP